MLSARRRPLDSGARTVGIPPMSDAEEHDQPPELSRIEVQCLSCGRAGSFDGDDRRVAGTPLVHLTKRLLCSECGSRAVKAVVVRTPHDLARRMRKRLGSARRTT